MDFLKLKNKYLEVFSGDPMLVRAPGRINLIGEHTDYNDGFVLPAAIDREVVFALAENHSDQCRFYAMDLDQAYETRVDYLQYTPMGWPNYLMGVIRELHKRGHPVKGFDCVFGSDIPIGAGLSSSAAIECGMAYGLNTLFALGEEKMELVRLSQRAENDFVGVNCGIMDQFASVFGRMDYVFRLDCRSLGHQYFPFEMKNTSVLLIDTQVKHSLASSEYNTRRAECESGVRIIQSELPEVRSLRDVTPAVLESFRDRMDNTDYQRCDYVVGEIERVLLACGDLEKGDIASFGSRMYETHRGLSNKYEVSCDELDYLVDLSVDNDHITGARMMGGGFGGCTINLVKDTPVEKLEQEIGNAYREKFGQLPLFYEVKISDGVSIL